jgi:hypothetical protein
MILAPLLLFSRFISVGLPIEVVSPGAEIVREPALSRGGAHADLMALCILHWSSRLVEEESGRTAASNAEERCHAIQSVLRFHAGLAHRDRRLDHGLACGIQILE